MTIIVKNKETLVFEDFSFKCCIGKNGRVRLLIGQLRVSSSVFSMNGSEIY